MLEIVFPRFQISKFQKSREQPNLQQSDFGLDPPLITRGDHPKQHQVEYPYRR